ncbi:MAG: NUDIX domain-containing protein [Thermoplasmata archaeon]
MTPDDRNFRTGRPAVAELAAGAIVRSVGRLEVLLLHLTEEGRWCFPKGHVEPEETLEAAAIREVQEETGLEGVLLGPELAEVHYRFFDAKRDRNVFKTTVYFLASSQDRNVRTEPLFDEWQWASPSEARRLVRFATDQHAIDRLTDLKA